MSSTSLDPTFDVQMFGPYRLEEVIGRGGMGEVLRAFDTVRERTVAIKRLPALLANDRDFQSRFRREAEIAADLNDPHIIPIHDFGEIDGQMFIDMRLVDGGSLSNLLSTEGALPPARAVHIVSQVAAALSAAHVRELVHRDVKPSNVLLSDNDFVYLVDFGLVRSSTSTTMTSSGAAIGTLDYVAPERFLKGHGDHRVDVYALGCVLFETLTGSKPFAGEGSLAMMYAHVNTPPPTPSAHAAIPAGFDAVIARAMAKNPDDRYDSTAALAEDAVACLSGSGPAAATVQHAATAQHVTAAGALGMANVSGGAAGAGATSPAASVWGEVYESTPDPSRKRRKVLVPLVLAGVVGLGGVGVAWSALYPGSIVPGGSLQPGQEAPTQPEATPAPSGVSGGSANGAAQRVLSPPTVAATVGVEGGPGAVAVAPDGRTFYVLHRGHPAEVGAKGFEQASVLVIDAVSRQPRGRIQLPVGSDPGVVVISPDGAKAYVTTAAQLTILDLASNTVAGTIPWNARGPAGAVITPDGSTAYVVNSDSNTVSVVDTAQNVVSAEIQAGRDPRDVAVLRDGRTIYVSSYADSSVWVVDTATRSVVKTIPLPMSPGGLCASADGTRVYVAGGPHGGSSGQLVSIDTASNSVIGTAPITAGSGKISAVSPDGAAVYVSSFDRANGSAGAITMIDTRSNTVTGVVAVGRAPKRLAVSPDGRFIYVPNQSSNGVTVLNTGVG